MQLTRDLFAIAKFLLYGARVMTKDSLYVSIPIVKRFSAENLILCPVKS